MRIFSLSRPLRCGTFAIAAIMGSMFSIAPIASAVAAAAEASPLIVQQVADVRPVESADGAIHLVYELLLINQSAFAVSLDSVEVSDEQGVPLAEIDGAKLTDISRLSLVAARVDVLQPAQSSFVFFDVVMPQPSRLPQALSHRFVAHQSAPAEQGSISLGGLNVPPQTGVAALVSFTSPPLAVRQETAVVLAAPLHGGGWVVFRGCCDVATSHRGTTAIYDGQVHIAERYAVDFVRIGDAGRMIVGPGDKVESYVYYGEPVYAVGDGVIVSARNDEPTQTPGALSADISDDAAGGNAVTIDLGSGRFAFYAHMQPGSVRVQAGDVVKAGDVIGLLGNSGRSLGPHLHFHVSDRASPMNADGLPFVFESFEGQGVLSGDGLALAMQGEVVPADAARFAGQHRHAMPVNSQVIDFGE